MAYFTGTLSWSLKQERKKEKEEKKTEAKARDLPGSNGERRDVAVVIDFGRGLADFSRHDVDIIVGNLDAVEQFLDDGSGIRLETAAGRAEGAGGVLELGHVGGDGPLQGIKVSY